MKAFVKNRFAAKCVLSLCLLSGAAAFAQQQIMNVRQVNVARPAVRVEIAGSVSRDNQRLALDKIESVKTGETLDWTINSINEGAGEAQNYRVVGQIPKGTEFVAGSIEADHSPAVTYSVDNGKTFAAQPVVQVRQPDGTVKTIAAPVSAYTQLRYEWTSALAANSAFAARYRVRVR